MKIFDGTSKSDEILQEGGGKATTQDLFNHECIVAIIQFSRGCRTCGPNGRPLARAPDDELRKEDPARRRHLRRGRGEVTPQRSGLSARLRGSEPCNESHPRHCERVVEVRGCVGARKRRRTRGREGKRDREKEKE